MKKLLSVLLSVVMVLAMTVTAFAAPSPSSEIKAVSGTAVVNGSEMTLDVAIETGVVKFASATQTATAPAGQTVVASTDVTLADGVESLAVVLEVQGVKKGEKVTVMQYVDGKWITLEGVAIADNQVQVTVTKSGTVAVCVAAADGSASGSTDKASDSKTTTGSSTGSATSPKTGEANAAMVAMLAVLFAGAAVVTAKKANA